MVGKSWHDDVRLLRFLTTITFLDQNLSRQDEDVEEEFQRSRHVSFVCLEMCGEQGVQLMEILTARVNNILMGR